MRKVFYFLAGFIAGIAITVIFFVVKVHKEQQGPIIIKVPAESQSGLPVAIIELPTAQPDMTRHPSQDNITPPSSHQAAPATEITIAPHMHAWDSNFGPQEYFPAHRHPVARLIVPWNASSLERVHADGSKDTLLLQPNTILIFAPDASGQWHDDYNPSATTSMQATVVEITPVN